MKQCPICKKYVLSRKYSKHLEECTKKHPKIKTEEEEEIELPQPTLEDFSEVAKKIKEYTATEMTEAAKESKMSIFPSERFIDVGGLHEIRNDIINEIKWSLYPELAKQVGYEPPRGFLFEGPSGTGKTLLAKAIAGEFKVPFYLVKGPSLFRKWVGESEKAVRDIFQDAKKNAPAIIFMDELDALGIKRGTRIGDAGVGYNVLTTLLTELDGYNPLGQVVFIGSTNRVDMLDPALMSRLTRKFHFGYPATTAEKKEVIEVHLRNVKELLEENITSDLLLEPFMKYTFSPRLIADSIKQAIRERGKEVMACIEILEAIEKDDPIKVKEIRKRYKESFKNIHQRYRPKGIDLNDRVAVYRKIASSKDNPKIYPIKIYHIKDAIEKIMKDELYEERLEMQRIYKNNMPVVGKVYGLAVEGKELQRGIILPIETKIFKASEKNKGKVVTFGTVGETLKESSQLATIFLREYFPNIVNKDIYVHIPSPSEGIEPKIGYSVSGPSAQQAIALSIFSALTNFPARQDVCVTGKLDIFNGKAGLVGGIHPKKGSSKIDIAAEEGFKIVIIPQLGYKRLVKDFPEYIKVKKKIGLDIVGGDTFWDYAKILFNKDIKTLKKVYN